MAAEKTKKCAHPPCTCQTPEKYCSVECAAMEKTPDLSCDCGHPACNDRAN